MRMLPSLKPYQLRIKLLRQWQMLMATDLRLVKFLVWASVRAAVELIRVHFGVLLLGHVHVVGALKLVLEHV